MHITGYSQQCYSQPNCVAGSEIATPADNPTRKDCCAGTNEGQSYADSGGNCIVSQCLGKFISNCSYMHPKFVHKDICHGGLTNFQTNPQFNFVSTYYIHVHVYAAIMALFTV